jgi:hypothetical protein
MPVDGEFPEGNGTSEAIGGILDCVSEDSLVGLRLRLSLLPEKSLAYLQGIPREQPQGNGDLQAFSLLLVEVWRICGPAGPPLSVTDAESVFEFIRMLQAPGPHDQNVLGFIRNHLTDPELRAQRGEKGTE